MSYLDPSHRRYAGYHYLIFIYVYVEKYKVQVIAKQCAVYTRKTVTQNDNCRPYMPGGN